ncbi:MAG: actin, cytoplasmic 2 [Candidatus Hodarchaeota archaeon]
MKIRRAIVIDIGSSLMKAGFSDEDYPRWIFSTLLGYPRFMNIMDDVDHYIRNYYVGEEAQQLRGVLNLVYPVECGLVVNWDAITKIWNEYFQRYFQINPSEHPVLLTEPPLHPTRNREKMAEVFFEIFNVPAIYVSISAVLSLYASGRTTGVIVDMGESVTQVVPIYEGLPISQAISRLDIGGSDITQYFHRLLRRSGYSLSLIRDIKERLCYVALDPEREQESDREEQYILPDGEAITLGTERFLAPETYFHPTAMEQEEQALHEVINNTLQQCDTNLRSELCQNIILSGGSSLFPGLKERLHKELSKMLPKTKIRIITPSERQYSAWIGGSLLSSMAAFKQHWITREEYKKRGSSVINRCIESPFIPKKD